MPVNEVVDHTTKLHFFQFLCVIYNNKWHTEFLGRIVIEKSMHDEAVWGVRKSTPGLHIWPPWGPQLEVVRCGSNRPQSLITSRQQHNKTYLEQKAVFFFHLNSERYFLWSNNFRTARRLFIHSYVFFASAKTTMEVIWQCCKKSVWSNCRPLGPCVQFIQWAVTERPAELMTRHSMFFRNAESAKTGFWGEAQTQDCHPEDRRLHPVWNQVSWIISWFYSRKILCLPEPNITDVLCLCQTKSEIDHVHHDRTRMVRFVRLKIMHVLLPQWTILPPRYHVALIRLCSWMCANNCLL